MNNENLYYVDSRKADKNIIVILAGITYPDPDYTITRENSGIYVFEYVIEGRGVVWVNSVRHDVGAGDVYILKKCENHHYYSDKKNPMKKIWFNVDGRIAGHLISDYSLAEVTHIKGFGDSSIFFEIRKKLLECKAERRLHGSDMDIMFHSLIKACADFIKSKSDTKGEAEIIKEYIDTHLDGSLTVDEVSAQIFRSKTHTINAFKKAFGQTPYDYMLERRIETAKILLKDTAMKISDVCRECGFTDEHYFSRYFKKRMGVTPKQWRVASKKK